MPKKRRRCSPMMMMIRTRERRRPGNSTGTVVGPGSALEEDGGRGNRREWSEGRN